MNAEIESKVDFAGLKLNNPVFTVSGTCGYGDELEDFIEVNELGGFITKSITAEPRKGNPIPRIVETNSGMLNAIGLANIGLERFIEEKIPVIRKLGTKVFVNVAGSKIEDYLKVTERLAGLDKLAGFELNISCPNVKKGGISFGTDPKLIAKITKVVKKAAKDKVLIVKLTPAVTDISVTARAAVENGADALSLVNTFTAMVIDIDEQRPVLANRTGGLSGPAIKPMAIYLVNKVYNEVCKEADIPILGLGGIRSAEDAVEFMLAGATAVGVGTGNFIDPTCCVDIINGLENYCKNRKIKKVSELTGSLK